MTPAELADVIEEIAAWSLEARRAYLANLEIFSAEKAKQVKDGLTRYWAERK